MDDCDIAGVAKWCCPKCGELVETDYSCLQVAILRHERKCTAGAGARGDRT